MRTWAILLGMVGLFSPRVFAQTAAAPAGAAKELASIEGRVINAVTGEPVRKVSLTLSSSGAGSISAGSPQNASAVSDADGKFTFQDLEPGRYSLSANKTGFVRQQYGARAGQLGPGTPLTLVTGQKIKDLEFKLTPQAVISGKVVDEDGEPLSGGSVQVFRQTAYANRRMSAGGMSTNDVGEFRVGNLAPGKYILHADYRRGMFGAAPPPQAADGEGSEDYVPTFYASTTDVDAAVPIAVQPGQEVTGIEIRLQKARVYRIRGKILGIAVGGSTRIQVTLRPQKATGGTIGMFLGGFGNVKPDGSFELQSVQPGAYFVTATGFDGGRPQVIGQAPVTVGRSNVDGIVIAAGVPFDITGKVEVEGEEKPKITGSVLLQPAEGFGFGVSPSRIQDDGTFKIEGVSRDRYCVTVSGLPEGTYMKQVKAGGSDVLECGLDLTQANSAPALEVLVSPNAATIEGVVRHEDKPWPGASIMLLPEPIRPDRARWLLKTSTSDQTGQFSLKGVAPGEYRLYAWEEFVPVSEIEPEQLKPYESYAVKIKVGAGARERVELKLAPPQQ